MCIRTYFFRDLEDETEGGKASPECVKEGNGGSLPWGPPVEICKTPSGLSAQETEEGSMYLLHAPPSALLVEVCPTGANSLALETCAHIGMPGQLPPASFKMAAELRAGKSPWVQPRQCCQVRPAHAWLLQRWPGQPWAEKMSDTIQRCLT